MTNIIISLIIIISLSSSAFAQGREESQQSGQNFSFEVDLTAEVYQIAARYNRKAYAHNPHIPELVRSGLFPADPALFQAFLQACDYVAPRSVEILNRLEEFKGIITRAEFLEVFEELYFDIGQNQYLNKMHGFSSYASCTHSHIGTEGSYIYSGPNQTIGNLPGQFGMPTHKLTTTWGLNCEYGRMNDPLICSVKIRYSITQSNSMRYALLNLEGDPKHGKTAAEALTRINNTRSPYERLLILKRTLDAIKEDK